MTTLSANDVRNDFAETLNRLDALAGDPRPPGVEALQGPSDLCRVRVGDYRIVYQLEHTALVVLVVRIGHRREIYRRKGG